MAHSKESDPIGWRSPVHAGGAEGHYTLSFHLQGGAASTPRVPTWESAPYRQDDAASEGCWGSGDWQRR